MSHTHTQPHPHTHTQHEGWGHVPFPNPTSSFHTPFQPFPLFIPIPAPSLSNPVVIAGTTPTSIVYWFSHAALFFFFGNRRAKNIRKK